MIYTAATTLLQLLHELQNVLPADLRPILEMNHPVTLEPNEIYISQGDMSKKIAFIERGIIRAYTIKSNGEEATLLLRSEGELIASHDSIIKQQPSRFVYRALEKTYLLETDYDVLENTMKKHKEYEPLRNILLMKMLSEALDGLTDFVTLSAEERYQKLLSNRFDVVDRVPDKYIASMLGITPVSLSRIRKRFHSRKRY